MTHWYLVSRVDVRARILADDHYNRQSIGALNFTPPGNVIVLIIPNPNNWQGRALAVWASQRPDPDAGLDIRQDGFTYWNNTLFRSELPKDSEIKASHLIQEAVAITIGMWGKPFPKDGFHTFVDPKYVKPTIKRGKPIWGYSYYKAGFDLYPEVTKNRKLWRWVLSPEKMDRITSILANNEYIPLFA